MIKTLRKRHLQIWILLAFALPIGIAAAWMAVPKKVTQDLLQPPMKTQNISIVKQDTLNKK